MQQHWSAFCNSGSTVSGVKIHHLISCRWVVFLGKRTYHHLCAGECACMSHHTLLYLAAKRLPTRIALSECFQSKIWQIAVLVGGGREDYT